MSDELETELEGRGEEPSKDNLGLVDAPEHGEEAEASPKEPAKTTGLSEDDIVSILAKAIPSHAPAAPAVQEKTYSQAEINKMLNVWEPDSGFLKKLGFAEPTEENLKAVHELRDSLVRQANTMAEARIKQLLDERMSGFEDVREYISEQRATATANAFYNKYEELKPYGEIVDAVSAKLESSGFKAGTQEKVFEEIAKNAQAVLTRMNIKPTKAAPTNGKSRMATLAGSGQSGGKPGGTPTRKAGMAIFDDTED